MGIYFGGFPGIYREPGRAEGKGCGIIWFDCRSSGMTKREEFFNIKTYEEFDRRREEFRGMPMDQEILRHASKLFGRSPNLHEELYRTPPLKQCRKCRNWKEFNGCGIYPQVLKEIPVKDGEEVPCQYRESGE